VRCVIYHSKKLRIVNDNHLIKYWEKVMGLEHEISYRYFVVFFILTSPITIEFV